MEQNKFKVKINIIDKFYRAERRFFNMKKLLGFLMVSILVLAVIPGVLATSVGTGIGLDITPEESPVWIWGCDARTVLDDTLQGGRNTSAGVYMGERVHNYAFEGEQIQWEVLVMDKNKIEQVTDVVGTLGTTQGVGNDIEVECVETTLPTTVPAPCNARILEEDLTGDTDSLTQAYYTCTLTVETSNSMQGEYFITVEAISVDSSAIMAENEYWFLNPVIALTVDGDLEFTDVRPGTIAYSNTLLVGNDAEEGSGVMLDMFISGTDFYDPASSGARCPVTNRLKLGDQTLTSSDNGEADATAVADDVCAINLGGTETGDQLCYHASQGAYSTSTDVRADAEGYVPIEYGDEWALDFYNDAEIIATPALTTYNTIDYFSGNILSPGSELAITFKLGLPEPCVGDFSDGDIYFWGEAI